MSPHPVITRIQRYSMTERVVHWTSAVTYTYVLATGLAFYSPHLYWLVRLATSHAVFLAWSFPLWRRVFRVSSPAAEAEPTGA